MCRLHVCENKALMGLHRKDEHGVNWSCFLCGILSHVRTLMCYTGGLLVYAVTG